MTPMGILWKTYGIRDFHRDTEQALKVQYGNCTSGQSLGCWDWLAAAIPAMRRQKNVTGRRST